MIHKLTPILIIVLCILKIDSIAFAANLVNTGSLTLTPTFESVGIVCTFSGDDNGDMKASVTYRQVGGEWQQAHPAYIDRRDTVLEYGSPVSNAHKNEIRVSLMGLARNTEYEVNVTLSDEDGVNGGNPIKGTVKTWSHDQAAVGTIVKTVCSLGCDYSTIQSAIDAASAGFTIKVSPGTYSGFIINKDGNSNNYITIESLKHDNMAIINSTISVNSGDYIRLSHLQINSDLNIAGGQYSIIDHCIVNNGRIYLSSNSVQGLLIENCTIKNSSPKSDESGTGIYVSANCNGGFVIRKNYFDTVWDGVGGTRNAYRGAGFQDSDIYNNEVVNSLDDALEIEGDSINVRVWGNLIHESKNSGIGLNPIIYGPIYVHNNIISNISGCGIKLGRGTGPGYIVNNTFWNVNSGLSDTDNPPSENLVLRNNIFKANSYIYEVGGNGYILDHNNWDNTGTTTVKWKYKLSGEMRYYSLSEFQEAYPSLEKYSISVNSNFTDPKNFNFFVNSLVIDSGTVIYGINTDFNGNARPKGNGFEIGAIEVSGEMGNTGIMAPDGLKIIPNQ